jgi:transglutaminase/protease-like cytokinesis protein 3
MARELLTAGWEELKKPLSTKDRKNVLYNLARVAHRGGWGAERDAYLTSFESLGLDERERTAVARFRELAHTIEPALQQNALVEYALALQGSLAPYEQDRLKYTMADLYRRTNQPEKAREFFKAVLNSEASDELRGLAQFLLAD